MSPKTKVKDHLPIELGGSLYRAYLKAEKQAHRKVREKANTRAVFVDGDEPKAARVLVVTIPSSLISWITPEVAKEQAKHLLWAALAAEAGRSTSGVELEVVLGRVASISGPEHRKVAALLRRMRKVMQ